MTVPNASDTIDHLGARLASEHTALAQQWLERLERLLLVEPREVFPSPQLLDHIPALILEVAEYLRAPADREIAANTAVMAKASELGLLRFDQRASVHQVLREYQIFSEILQTFFAEEVAGLGSRADPAGAVRALNRAAQAVRVLEQQTVDAFIRRYTETIERQTAQLRNFSRLVSHEIRQPLSVLQVISRLIPGTQTDTESTRLVQTLERNVVRLAEVAGMLERLAKLSRRADNSPSEQAADLSAVARDVSLQLADMAHARNVTIHVEDSLPTLVVDAGRLELVMMNLLANAVKYCDPAKPHRLVYVRPAASDSGPRIQIADNGLGIPRSKLDVIFDQFVRAHAHLDDELGAQGMGLGLSIARECMDAMGGSIAVESREGHGTTFTLEWSSTALQGR